MIPAYLKTKILETEKSSTFTFIDLFAGIGGFRLALQNLGGECVFSCEWDKFAQKTYQTNYGVTPLGDIRLEGTKSKIPLQFDLLCAGFPCQPFSIAGISKKKSLGRATGFLDQTQGTLFFEVVDIIAKHRPKAFFLENVKNLLSHDKGKTFQTIEKALRSLNYSFYYQVYDARDFTPQHRERIFMLGYDLNFYTEPYQFPISQKRNLSLKTILEQNVPEEFSLSDKLWLYLQTYQAKHQVKGNGFGFGLADLEGVSRTLSARYYKDGSEILIPQNGKNPRRLTPRKCARLMGFPDTFNITAVSKTQAYKQLGNSVVVPLVQFVGESIITYLAPASQ
ncbi:MAG: DNA (cytosine-5-)-methyltransferase [Bacteroides sp.]